ncbi:hypothetical protein P167DRAFT_539551 [Morchella conica CCBAS932]|uniref:Secreted protein n=1 Tax=Morchella conica CCBAS932 TaxID=1392247 RepID=A0A3N4KC83_9PEZI|nr:hypothetical protein P167DRAFT_539551 [Morchella conica CCBAS932]
MLTTLLLLSQTGRITTYLCGLAASWLLQNATDLLSPILGPARLKALRYHHSLFNKSISPMLFLLKGLTTTTITTITATDLINPMVHC